MTRQLAIESPKAPYEVFRTLRKNNPSPFGGFFNYGNFQVVAASPERFLKVKDHHIVTRPIKGTRKRGETPEEDALLRAELEASEKDKTSCCLVHEALWHQGNFIKEHTSQCDSLDQILGTLILTAKYVEIVFFSILSDGQEIVSSMIRDGIASGSEHQL